MCHPMKHIVVIYETPCYKNDTIINLNMQQLYSKKNISGLICNAMYRYVSPAMKHIGCTG